MLILNRARVSLSLVCCPHYHLTCVSQNLKLFTFQTLAIRQVLLVALYDVNESRYLYHGTQLCLQSEESLEGKVVLS